jgi:hypothetical protein
LLSINYYVLYCNEISFFYTLLSLLSTLLYSFSVPSHILSSPLNPSLLVSSLHLFYFLPLSHSVLFYPSCVCCDIFATSLSIIYFVLFSPKLIYFLIYNLPFLPFYRFLSFNNITSFSINPLRLCCTLSFHFNYLFQLLNIFHFFTSLH